MPVPIGKVDPEVGAYLQELEDRLAVRERAQAPFPVFACTSANLPPAAAFVKCVLLNTTLGVLCVSNGTAWIRQDTGAAI